MRIERRGRYWAVYDGETLVALTVYKKGAREVKRRLEELEALATTIRWDAVADRPMKEAT